MIPFPGFRRYCVAARVATALIHRTPLPQTFCIEVRKKIIMMIMMIMMMMIMMIIMMMMMMMIMMMIMMMMTRRVESAGARTTTTSPGPRRSVWSAPASPWAPPRR